MLKHYAPVPQAVIQRSGVGALTTGKLQCGKDVADLPERKQDHAGGGEDGLDGLQNGTVADTAQTAGLGNAQVQHIGDDA